MPMTSLFFGFEGRINRRSFWLAVSGLVTFTTFGLLAVVLVLFGIDRASGQTRANVPAFFGLMIAYAVTVCWSWGAVLVKRLHDLDEAEQSGYREEWHDSSLRTGDVYETRSVAMFLALGFAPGAPGPNSHGPPPPGG